VNRRIVRKVMRSPARLRSFGVDRARGSRRGRRGRRAILRHYPSLRDRGHLPVDRRLDLLERDLRIVWLR